jgi:hypothetical protein
LTAFLFLPDGAITNHINEVHQHCLETFGEFVDSISPLAANLHSDAAGQPHSTSTVMIVMMKIA